MNLITSIDNLTDDIFLCIFSYLRGGMILRCGVVCKRWYFITNTDIVWGIILSSILHNGIYFISREYNRKIIQIWKNKKPGSLKKIYIDYRRKQNIKSNMRVFPKS